MRLTLRNFLCYSESQTLDFTGIHLACLAGDNGAGKTALLDAMTWALWGKCRAKTEDEVIHLGQTEAEVEFEFDVGEQRYRVIRKRRRQGNRSGTSSLELQIAEGERFRTITEPLIRATEKKIIDILHMDYETFVNSAFLMQGRADMFTLKTPDERKKVLSDILDLAQFERLELRARELARQRDAEAKALKSELARIDDQLARRAEYEAERDQISVALQALDESAQRQQRTVMNLRDIKQLVDGIKRELDQTEARLTRAQQQREQAQYDIVGHQAALARYEAILEEADTIRAGYDALQRVRMREQEATHQFRRLHDLSQHRSKLEHVIDSTRSQLEATEMRLLDKLQRLDAVRSKAPEWEAELAALEQQEKTLEERRAKLAQRREQQQQAQTQAQVARENAGRLREEASEIADKLMALQTSDQPSCPVCQQPLSREHRRNLIADFMAEQKAKETESRKQNENAQALNAVAERHRQEAERLERELKRMEAQISSHVATAQAGLAQAGEAAREWESIRQELEAVHHRLDEKAYAEDEQRELREVIEAIDALAYDEDAYLALQAERARLEPFEARFRELAQAEHAVEQERAALARAQEQYQYWVQECTQLEGESESLQASLTEHADTETRLATAERELVRIQAQQADRRQALGAVEQQLAHLADLETQRAQKQKEFTTLDEEHRIYRELTAAFGRSGVQALIIDAVLPELEDEANELLARMTSGRMHLTMTTQRLNQSGTVRETLDIRIADELGTRNYELFSGGEAFRINFALRIALSRLLARRAGAPLRTLIIDEGFGTQDTSGRDRLIEAIRAIQDDFDCILVITHIDELRDAFPVRVAVEKSPHGSVASIVR